MKKNEIALLILVVSIVALATYLVVNALAGQSSAKAVTVERADRFSDSVVAPDERIFRDNAINPTVKVKIGDQSNQQPFTLGQ